MERWASTGLPAALVGVLVGALGWLAQAQVPVEPLVVVPVRVSETFEPVVQGYAEWLRSTLADAGLDPGDGAEARALEAEFPDGTTSEDALAFAARGARRRALLLDVREKQDQLEVLLRLYDVSTRRLLAVGRARGAPVELARLGDEALAALRTPLGLPSPRSDGPMPRASLDDFAAASRALAALDGGELAEAWRALEGRPALEDLRLPIQRRAKDGRGVAYEERVRLLAAMGDMDTAWAMIFARAEAQLTSSRAHPEVMQAAGEVQLHRGELDAARDFLDRAIELDPENADAHESLGRLSELERDVSAAREAYARAVELEPTVERLTQLATLEEGDPAERARLLLDAGRRASAELRSDRAFEAFGEVQTLAPDLAADVHLDQARLHARLLDFEPAAREVGRSLDLGGETRERLLLNGRASRAVGDLSEAEESYERLVELEPQDSIALRELGAVQVEAGRPDVGLRHLERAAELAPEDPTVVRELARGRRRTGDLTGGLELLERAEQLGTPEPEDLLERAAIERELGQLDAAIATLERAAEVEPGDADIYRALARDHRESGDEQAAVRYDALVLSFGGVHHQGVLADGPAREREDASPSIRALVDTFLMAAPEARRVMVLPVYERDRARIEELFRWVMPRIPDTERIRREMEAAIAAQAEVVPSVTPTGFYAQKVRQLSRFDDDGSLDTGAVVTLNGVFDADAILLARLEPRPSADPEAPVGCGVDPYYRIQARLLSGRLDEHVRMLGYSACLPGGAASYGRWNPRAMSLLGVLLAMLLYPVLRGWGHVTVQFQLPPKTRALFSVRLSRRRPRLRDEAPTDDARWRIREKLQGLNRNEKRLSEGTSLAFGWVAARRRPYVITVRGPLLDYQSDELIGSFNAEKQVRVMRGQKVEVEFDMRPKQASVEVRVMGAGGLCPDARVGVRGDSRSVRFTRGKPAFLYLDPGDYVLVAGAGGAVAEKPLCVADRAPMQVVIDLCDDQSQVFGDCEDAVTPYLEGHFEGAARALDASDLRRRASQVRALTHLGPGDASVVSSLLVDDAGSGSAPVPLDPKDARAASVLEQAGRHAEAAQGFLAQGDLRAAAEAFERVYDWDGAADCYRNLGDQEALLEVLERAGESYEAACVALKLGDARRALGCLRQVDHRDRHYTEACLMEAELLAAEGDVELAIEKFEGALSQTSSEGIPLDSRELYASLLEDAGRIDDAIEVLRGIRRIDPDHPGARERIEALRAKGHQATELAAATRIGSAGRAAPAPSEESRYEILSELGRGAMGIVYKARDRVLGRMVALKQLPENMREHQLAVQYFLREARSAAALNHPNIVTIYDAGQEGQVYFITMECLEGTPIDAILERRQKLSPRDTSILGVQAATGLHYAHGQRIIHRDIKASNLFYTKDRVVKIMDFGLAKAVEEVRKQASVIAGTPYYMPPEQAIGGIVDHRSDLYSLGVTLFQLCTGGVPFQQGDVTYHHAHTPAPDPRERVPEIPEALARLILQLMAKDPDARVQSAAEVAQRLRQGLS